MLVEPARRLPEFERIVLTGMGASLAALLPLWLRLLADGRPAWRMETAELLAGGSALLTRRTLVIAASQSGRSAELIALTESARERGASILAITNDIDSPLANAASWVAPIMAGIENAVSTKTYVNTLAACHAIGQTFAGEAPDDAVSRAADAIEEHLADWQGRLDRLRDTVGAPERLYVVARGSSLAAAECGALIIKEAAKHPIEASSVPQFRHGPMELADARLTVLVIGGEAGPQRERNRRFMSDLVGYGARAFWIDDESDDQGIAMPRAIGPLRSIAEIVPLQFLAVVIGRLTGVEPGRFRHLGKVTQVE